MKEVLPKLKLKTLKASPNAISSPELGGWPLALQLAGVSRKTRLWTGSPPCQPFSAAGKQLGQFDPRHLAPVFLELISQCRPPIIFGEQVAPAIGKSWMCDLQIHLEREDYAVGFAVLPACSVGAPHKRERLFFGAHELADTESSRPSHRGERPILAESSESVGKLRSVADASSEYDNEQYRSSNVGGRKDDSEQTRLGGGVNSTNPCHGFWSGADWLGCRDGKFRPVEPGTFPLANGVPGRVGRLRGYGNAIVPEVAAEFVTAFMEAARETIKG